MLDRNQRWPTVISRQDFEEDVHIGLAGLVEHGVIDVAGFEEELAWPVYDGLVGQHVGHVSRGDLPNSRTDMVVLADVPARSEGQLGNA
jgi:hypothetical protein